MTLKLILKHLKYKSKKILNWLLYRRDGHKPDYNLLILLLAVLILGLIFLSSASSVVSFDKHLDPYYFFKNQFFKVVFFGLIMFFITSHIPYSFFKKYSLYFLLVGIVLLVLVFLPFIGQKINGAQRWLKIFGLTFQPTEYVKIALIIYLAAWFDSHAENIKSFKITFLPFLILLILISTLILLQPDMGTAFLIIALSITMYYLAGGHIGILTTLLSIGSIIFYFLIKKSSYRLARLQVFLKPDLDPQGIGYHLNQAMLAIGSGGIFGKGLGHSRQKYNYLPEVYSDSIFAVIAEELGFIFTALFLLFYFFFFYQILKIGLKSPDNFAKLFVLGYFSLLIWQTFLNIMAMLGLIPLTGAPLPFISYGSSSLVMLLTGMGIVFNISKYTFSK